MTNFVFSRRAIQACINGLARTLDHSQLASLVERLNAKDASRLDAMWEAVFLHGLSQACDLLHERTLPNGRRPDIDWKINKREGDSLSIIADITTVSDEGLEDQNPIKFLSTEIIRLASKLGLPPGSFWSNVRGKTIGQPQKSKIRLMLPEKAAINSFIKNHLEPWFYSVKNNKKEKSIFNCTEENLNLSIIYDPNWKNGGGSYTSYTVATSKSANPLFNALKGKVKQLNGAPSNAIRAIFVCDGGCELIRQGPSAKSHYTFTSREVAEDFLRQNTSIDFVLLTTVKEHHHPFGFSRTYQMSYELVCAAPNFRSKRVTTHSIDLLEQALNIAFTNTPQPLRPPHHSASMLKNDGVGNDQLGAHSMQGEKITISSRGLIRFLAGQISTEEFNQAHRWGEPNAPQNPFARHLQNGLMISKIEVTSGNDTDDDKITFTIDKFDVANSPFVLPASDESNHN